jgi:ABC-type polysaccharide/polyol phosphate transport system ATPase subunit
MIDLRFTNVSKRYRIRRDGDDQISTRKISGAIAKLRRRKEDFWAVKDVTFDVQRGQALGIIGHNGAGKSTILKLLSKITTPSSGEIVINGRLSALIEVGSGFHPELTGRENIYLSGSILGMLRREITEKLESIVDFAEIRRFIDTPVKRYSSGMYVRLGFSIAAHLDPDILLLDEVLAVGDASFQAKCIQRIIELKEAGMTIVFISHDLRAVEKLCDRVMLLKDGMVIADGEPRLIISHYQNLSRSLSAPEKVSANPGSSREAVITSLSFQNDNGEESLSFETGLPMRIILRYDVYEPVSDVIFEVQFHSQEGRLMSFFSSETTEGQINLQPGSGTVEFDCSAVGLGPGVYFVDAGIRNRHAAFGINIDWRHRCVAVRVDYDRQLRDTFYMPYDFRIIPSRQLRETATGIVSSEEDVRTSVTVHDGTS